jgi:ATP-dependent RNA helicase RhlE
VPFSVLGLSPAVCSPLKSLGYVQPTPVQAKAIPVVLEGRDLLARAETGSGKTAAFGLPLIDKLLVRSRRPPGADRRPRALVLVPTRELALQIDESLRAYGASLRLRSAVVVGGVPMGPQVRALHQGIDVLVATPGRLIDHLERRSVDLSAVELLTLDEADRMLDMGFLPPLRRILGFLPRDRQTLMLSATFSKEVTALSGQFTRDPVTVDVTSGNRVAALVAHRLHPVSHDRKRELLLHILADGRNRQTLVFCRTKHGSNRVCEHLVRAGVRAAAIHGNKSQGARTRALGDFKSGRVTVLVATDLAARGLDIEQLPIVINYELPMVAHDYIHRVGRTGRAGASGEAVSLVSHDEHELLGGIQKLLGQPIDVVNVAGFAAGAAPAAGEAGSGHAARFSVGSRSGHGGRPASHAGHGLKGGAWSGQRHARPGYRSPARAGSRRSVAG